MELEVIHHSSPEFQPLSVQPKQTKLFISILFNCIHAKRNLVLPKSIGSCSWDRDHRDPRIFSDPWDPTASTVLFIGLGMSMCQSSERKRTEINKAVVHLLDSTEAETAWLPLRPRVPSKWGNRLPFPGILPLKTLHFLWETTYTTQDRKTVHSIQVRKRWRN